MLAPMGLDPGDDESSRCRDAPSHPSFAHAKKSQAERPSQKSPPQKKKGGGAPRGACRIRIEKRCGARPFSFPPCGRTEAARTSWSGRARLSAPHRGIRGFLGLGSARAALPGTTGCKREDPLRHQCSEHLAVRHAPDGTMPKPPANAVYRHAHENHSRSASRSTLAKAIVCQLTKAEVTCNRLSGTGRRQLATMDRAAREGGPSLARLYSFSLAPRRSCGLSLLASFRSVPAVL